MARYRLLLEYDGTPFVGWQRQGNGLSIQAALEDAVLAFTGERVRAVAAGRTDAGVHALGQVVHLDLAQPRPATMIRRALNYHLKPAPIVVLAAEEAAPGFHARFSATRREYRYRILNRVAPPALLRNRVWFVARKLNAAAMRRAAVLLVGRHDFTSFRAASCQASSPIKTLDALTVARRGEEIVVSATARSFLHHQVRNIVGTLKLVGEGKWSAEQVAAALAARDRAAGGPTAPPHGLYLVRVGY
ncbi:MAG: tRNA pseudouridine(38-40) synthase TruA [Alphaproteobacteria bacterium]|nr:tRNA pseudouridine(38-40) synthase TruA [Alphaproteobacteria bacterium]